MFIARNVPPKTAFAASRKFWYVVFLISPQERQSSDHSLLWFLEEPPLEYLLELVLAEITSVNTVLHSSS